MTKLMNYPNQYQFTLAENCRFARANCTCKMRLFLTVPKEYQPKNVTKD
ncbi:hypothetical protein [Bombilactobacillus thymidiniphilus]|uniref:Uncharacterized protein n=1 Tax=Bombilactobacillus thymidiniphilus TaxID=2923363 RepID=A0ABY4PCX4_9LACO|nr:hypothetical protein [Bombilactobacillus thymidiniphilus]UQS83613.1 hypothetical protein MOO47_07570 [Bombilactobacillus thymidiniphilus]UQS83614.1 hypothetical protein MOO47_07575 [Bombilactobacillus thymidiniphilus]UQS83633.1 hypothetical protein MOO47_00055 [Bombilactobacillus thymidiniphilus]UQS83634.1 hypothetical protein MOO47_00060 [Bombilactobacillus thymidiniphilus]